MREGYRHMKDDLEQLRDLYRRQGHLIDFMIKRLEEENNQPQQEEKENGIT